MKILAIDTATEACSAALYINGEITESYQLAPREHTKLILQIVQSLLDDAKLKVADLDAITFGRGPGSFTGVRIATGVVQGLAFAADVPVIPISTLASIAQSVYDDHQKENVLAGIDARMGEIYWGCYSLGSNNLMQLQGEECVSRADKINLNDSSTTWVGAGSAWQNYTDELSAHLGTQLTASWADYYPHSRSIAKLAAYEFEQGNVLPAAQAQPVYLRNDVAKKSSKKPVC